MSMNFNWNFAQPTNGQAAFDAAQAALQNKRNNAYTQNMDDRQVGNANDMMSWMQQGNDAAAYQQEQALAAEQQAQQAQQEAAQKQAQIDSIKARINELESQIAANQAKLKNWQGVGGKVAALEARKINSQDPTSVWRWKAGMDAQKAQRAEDLERIEKEKAKTKEEQKQFIRNKISSTLPTMSIGWKTSPEQIQQFKNTLAGLKTEAMNSKLSDQYNDILEAEAQLNGQLPQQKAQMAMDAMANAATMFNVTKDEGGFGKDPKAYHDYLLQQYTQITREFPEAKYDPAFNKAFSDADKLYRKKVKTNKVKPSGRR